MPFADQARPTKPCAETRPPGVRGTSSACTAHRPDLLDFFVSDDHNVIREATQPPGTGIPNRQHTSTEMLLPDGLRGSAEFLLGVHMSSGEMPMRYTDDLDRLPDGRMSRREFLTSGGVKAASLAASGLIPPAGNPLMPGSSRPATERPATQPRHGDQPDQPS